MKARTATTADGGRSDEGRRPERRSGDEQGSGLRTRFVAAHAAFLALLLHFVLYRVVFWYALEAQDSPEMGGILGWNYERPLLRFIGAETRDLPIALAVALTVALTTLLFRPRRRLASLLGNTAVAFVLLVVGLMSAANIRMTLELNVGLDLPALFEARTAVGGDVNDFIAWGDLALAASPLLLFVGLRRIVASMPPLALRGVRGALLGGITLIAALPPGRGELWSGVRDHPILRIVKQELTRPDLQLEALPRLAVDARGRPGFVDPALIDAPPSAPRPAPPDSPAPETGPSLLLFVVDSLAMRQLDPPTHPGLEPMPYLQQLGREGWWLAQHHATANSSAQAAFALFTGIYDAAGWNMSVTSPHLRIPALWSRLPHLDTFLVSPARLNGYFPLGVMRNDGLLDVRDYYSLRHRATRPHAESTLNEFDGFDALAERLQETRGRRFFGVYWADAAHSPYFDGEPPNRLLPDPQDNLERYLNCLRVIDDVLRQTVGALREAGHGDDTILVVVGDHGEAFGEHGVYVHSRNSHEEVTHVPALIWQPALIPPRVDERLTAHVDLAPTILTALGVPFDPLEFQGESLFDERLRRRYVFSDGRQGEVVSWNRELQKVFWSYEDDGCFAFDLASDPEEKSPLDCAPWAEQLLANKRFFVMQDDLVSALSSWAPSRMASPGPEESSE